MVCYTNTCTILSGHLLHLQYGLLVVSNWARMLISRSNCLSDGHCHMIGQVTLRD
uniref:Uncharacterized protein n=1 Tax=Hyaloperonospora arabidopsidis (strain Emoy2) TaxID=559515 RepID=M4BE84_HYAAE